ncbi:MAG: sigma-70 family RNA polymerase sigma factor [Planctomycetota bacterium]|nr:sigma-70 family RNA polymerase sigma factor [Planctomycetota bacterium]
MDDAALEILVRRFEAHIFRYVKYLGADDAMAEDVVQETFLAALRSGAPPPASDQRRCSAWLRAIARRQFYLQCRGRRRWASVDEKMLAEAEAIWVAETGGDEDAYKAALARCLEKLDRRSRDLLERRYVRGESRESLAAFLGISIEGVKSALRRLKGELRACVRRHLAEERR